MILATMVLVAVFLLPVAAASAGGDAAMYEVKIENITAQQILSPAVFISHRASYRQFRMNGFANDELRQIAEDNNNGPAAMRARYSRSMFDVQTPAGGILPGTSSTVLIRTPTGARL